MKRVDKTAFGRRVAERREKLRMSQEQLASVVGMKQQGLAAIENGKVQRPRLLRELSAALRTTDEWLLWREGPENAEPVDPSITRVPVIDWVSAGRLAQPQSQIPVEDVPLLAFADLGRGEFFALRIQGTSMDRISPDGSTIVVDRADKQLVAGKPYVFWHKNEGTTYKLWRPGDPSYLEPASWDIANKPIFIKRKNDFEVIGRVRRTLLDL